MEFFSCFKGNGIFQLFTIQFFNRWKIHDVTPVTGAALKINAIIA